MKSEKAKQLFESYEKGYKDAYENVREYIVGHQEYTKDSDAGVLIDEILDIIHDV